MVKKLGIVWAALFLLTACKENVDTSARYVFTANTVISYLEKHEQYSEYYRLLGKKPVSSISNTTVSQLLSARGNYTVFAPTNEAIQLYLDTLAKQNIIIEASWEGFRDSSSLDSIEKVIVYNSIIDGGDDYIFPTYDFPTTNGSDIPLANMYDRKLTVTYDEKQPSAIYINDCPIDERNRDIPMLNGYIHSMNRVIAPSNNTLSHLLRDIVTIKENGYYVSALLAKEVGLMDTLLKVRDDEYEKLYLTGKIDESTARLDGLQYFTPEHRYYGFTYFAETDEFWSRALGKQAQNITVKDVMDYLIENDIYPDAVRDNHYENENNLLNRFVTYHFLPMMLQPGKLVYHYNELGYNPALGTPTIVMSEYYTTMGKRRLLKIVESRESGGVRLNRFPEIDNGRHGSYHELSCAPDKQGILVGTPNREGRYNVRNGIIYPIGELLVYNEKTCNNMGRERIRWDACAMFPEMINNDIRMNELTDGKHFSINFPSDEQYRYLENAWNGRSMNLHYRTGHNAVGWTNYLGDEFQLDRIPDMIIRMPPVPRRGTYELRFGIASNEQRSMVQCYWGTSRENLAAAGLPLDTRMGGLHRFTQNGRYPSGVGWEPDTDDDEYNAEVDKRMRNKDFMKNINMMVQVGMPGTPVTFRTLENCLRRIILRTTMDPNETYYLRFKGVLDEEDKFLYMDYLEYCPKEVYDNPENPEDIW